MFTHEGHLYCPSRKMAPAAQTLGIIIGLLLVYPYKIAVKCSLVPLYLLNSCLTLIIVLILYCVSDIYFAK